MTQAKHTPLADQADKAAKYISIRFQSKLSWDAVRDICDARTGGDLDCFQLDMLADMTLARLEKSTEQAA